MLPKYLLLWIHIAAQVAKHSVTVECFRLVQFSNESVTCVIFVFKNNRSYIGHSRHCFWTARFIEQYACTLHSFHLYGLCAAHFENCTCTDQPKNLVISSVMSLRHSPSPLCLWLSAFLPSSWFSLGHCRKRMPGDSFKKNKNILLIFVFWYSLWFLGHVSLV